MTEDLINGEAESCVLCEHTIEQVFTVSAQIHGFGPLLKVKFLVQEHLHALFLVLVLERCLHGHQNVQDGAESVDVNRDAIPMTSHNLWRGVPWCTDAEVAGVTWVPEHHCAPKVSNLGHWATICGAH